ncbi:unnamed protein product [Adineta steineri]|uniref:Uncharacterized protein n=1 Tax=Adineta steineri TaxID=433720 RepID=A0A814NA18_9BILA|nr:unnamed protein product [Adineta steineri]
MASCAVEITGLTTNYCQTTNSMKQSSSFETINPRCQFSFHADPCIMDRTIILQNHELTKKRQFNRSHTYSGTNEFPTIITDNNNNSCSSQAVPINNHESLVTSIRPKTLFPNESINNLSVPRYRTCLSHPSTISDSFLSNDDNTLSPPNFTSLPILESPPAKRLRPQTLNFKSTNQSVPIIAITNSSSSSSSTSFIESSELVNKLNENNAIVIFDCGSPFRYNENHIIRSNLLHVSDKVSRRRFKTNPTKNLTIDLELLNNCDSIILYDDNINNDQQLSAGIKCACEIIQRSLTIKYPSIFILKNSFEQFAKLYPNLCESSQISLFIPNDLPSSSSTTPSLDPLNYPMTHIIDGLFIGSESNAKNLEELTSENIRHIINVTSHVPLYHSEQCHYYHIPADDTQKQNLLDYFDDAYRFIQNAIENNEKVLVHCVAGISRSPAIVISFLMRYAHMTMNDAYEFVKQKRSIVSPNLNFMGQLLQYEKKLRDQNEILSNKN